MLVWLRRYATKMISFTKALTTDFTSVVGVLQEIILIFIKVFKID